MWCQILLTRKQTKHRPHLSTRQKLEGTIQLELAGLPSGGYTVSFGTGRAEFDSGCSGYVILNFFNGDNIRYDNEDIEDVMVEIVGTFNNVVSIELYATSPDRHAGYRLSTSGDLSNHEIVGFFVDYERKEASAGLDNLGTIILADDLQITYLSIWAFLE